MGFKHSVLLVFFLSSLTIFSACENGGTSVSANSAGSSPSSAGAPVGAVVSTDAGDLHASAQTAAASAAVQNANQQLSANQQISNADVQALQASGLVSSDDLSAIAALANP